MNTEEKATIDRIIEGAFLQAMKEEGGEGSKEAAQNLINSIFDKEVPETSPLYNLALGFVLGFNEGLKIASDL